MEQFIPVNQLREGDRLGRNVYREDGRLALALGIILTGKLIEGLKKLKLDGVYIDNRRQEAEAPSGPKPRNGANPQSGANSRTGANAAAAGRFSRSVSEGDDDPPYIEAIRQSSLQIVKAAFEEVAAKGTFRSGPIRMLAAEISRRFGSDLESSVQMKESRSEASYLMAHSVNVCLLSVLAARKLNYSEEHLRIVAIGALMHDIGYVVPKIANPAADHPRAGFDLLRKTADIPLLSAHIVLQHHEQLCGGGYPLGIRGELFRQSAQIVAIANDFDHFINELGKNRLPHEGIEYVMSKTDTSYDIAVVRAFVQSVVPYPVGTVVRLSNGMTGTVCHVDDSHPSRPTVVMRDPEVRVDLLKTNSVMISEVLMDRTLVQQ